MGDMTLLEWTTAYIKYKDSIKGKIKDLTADVNTNKIKVSFKDNTEEIYLCVPSLESLKMDNLSDEKIVCFNKKENLNWLTSKWESIKDKKCVFLFVNTKKSENWAINPRVHSSITDKSALKSGLKSLFESVPESD